MQVIHSKNFWKKLPKPFFILAPMADVTDSAFRQIICKTGKPDVLFTEFVSCDGLCSEKGKPKLMPHLAFKKNEHPIVAQFFGTNPKNFYKCAQLAVELGFDGIDINMGCPAGKIVKHDSGAGLIRNPELAEEIIRETKRGARSTGSGQVGDLPVSVKTRIGYNKIITEEWVSHLIEAKPAAIIMHGRTMKEMSKVPAHWDEIGKAAILCRKAGIPIIGNGDILSYSEGLEKAKQYGLDGIMVGRAIFSNPWFFNPSIDPTTKTPAERIELLKKHVELFIALWGKDKHPAPSLSADHHSEKGRAWSGASFDVMKKFFKIYVSGWEGAKDLRVQLMSARNPAQVREILGNKLLE